MEGERELLLSWPRLGNPCPAPNRAPGLQVLPVPLPAGARPGWPACLIPVRAHSMGMAIGYMAFPPPPRAESHERWMKPKGRLGEPPRAQPLSSADLRRGGLGWPQEREVSEFRLLGCQSHRTLDCSGGWALGPCPGTHGDTRWPDCPGPHRHLSQCKTRTRSLTLRLLPWAQRWETPNAGEGEEKTGWGSSPNFRPALHQLRAGGGNREACGCSHLRLGKQKQDREAGLWAGGSGAHSGAGPGPSHQARTQSFPSPKVWGPDGPSPHQTTRDG